MLRHKSYVLKPYKVGKNTFHALFVGTIRIGRIGPNIFGLTHPIDNYPFQYYWEIKLYPNWTGKDLIMYGGSIEGCTEAAIEVFREWLNQILF